MLTKCFEIVLILNLTGLFSFVAVQAGVSIGTVSGGLLAFIIVYLIANHKHAIRLLSQTDVILWVVFLFVWPIVSLLYADVTDYRAGIVNLYLIGLMLATAVWLKKVGIHRAGWVVASACVITIFGLILSLLSSDYFEEVADAANAVHSYQGRAFGFFLQPNMAAENISFLYVLVLPVIAYRSIRGTYLATAIFAAAVLITGSRGGMIIAVALIAYAYIVSGDRHRKKTAHGMWRKIGAIIAVSVALFVANYSIDLLTGNAVSSGHALVDRINAIMSLDFLGGGMSETSFARYIALIEHGEGIAENPVLGHGLAASSNLVLSGQMTYAAHNQYLQIAFDIGLPAVAMLVILIFRMWRKGQNRLESYFLRGIRPSVMLAISVGLAGIFSNTILTSRVFFAVLGAVFAMRYWSTSVFRESPGLRPVEQLPNSHLIA